MDAGKAVEAHAPGNVWLASIDGGRVVSCGADGAVCVYAVSDSSIVLEAKEVVHDAAIRAIAFDPKDSRLATVGEDRKTHVVSFPSLQDKRTALRSGVAARAAAFSTTGLLAIGGDPIVVADKGGGLTIFNLKMEAVVQDERLEVPAAAEDWHGAEEEEEYNPQVVAENLVGTEGNPDQEHDVAQSIENTIDLDHDEHDSKSPLRAPVRLHTSRKEISNEIAECQPAIHPGATPKNRTNRRFLAYNMVGCVITKEDVEDGVSHIEIEWWDHDFHRPIKFRDEYNFDMAAMGNEGVIFGGPPSPDGTHPSAIFYKPFDPWALKSDWTYYAANAIEEEFDAVAMGSGWVAASSSSKSAGQLLRIISLGVDASQIQMVTMYEVGTSMKKVFTEMLPLSPGEKLRWIGFSPFGVAALDTNHILRVYSESSSTWIPVFDGNSVKSSEDANEHFFIAGIDDRKVHCVHVRNARWPAVAPRPSVTGYPLAIPVLGKTSNSAADFDSELILERMRLTALRSQQEDPASVQRAITLFEKTLLTQLVSFAKNDSLVRALDLFDLLHLSKSRDIAIRMMQTLRMSALAERMYKSHQEKEVAEAAAQMAAASDNDLYKGG
eukprot:tig00020780_g13772.t1